MFNRLIYLVRHADYENPHGILPGRLPVPLSATGKKQAKKLHAYFQDKNIARIYSSAVLRCKQTSEILAGTTIPIVYDLRLLKTFSAYQGYWEEDWSQFSKHINELGRTH